MVTANGDEPVEKKLASGWARRASRREAGSHFQRSRRAIRLHLLIIFTAGRHQSSHLDVPASGKTRIIRNVTLINLDPI